MERGWRHAKHHPIPAHVVRNGGSARFGAIRQKYRRFGRALGRRSIKEGSKNWNKPIDYTVVLPKLYHDTGRKN